MQKYIDSHVHYNTKQFRKDIDKVLNSVYKESVKLIINCGVDNVSNKETLSLCKKYSFIFGTIGYFPCNVLELEENPNLLQELERMLQNVKMLGIGEIGLDYHWNSVGFGYNTIKGYKARKLQQKWFIKQIQLANKIKMPIVVHSRDAEEDTLSILKQYKPLYGCVIHCYSYGLKTAKELLDLGCYFGVGGTSTYKQNKELREVIKYIPLDRILLETDAPYLTPEPFRRERNDSSYIKYVISNIAKIKGVSEDIVIEETNNNVFNVFGL